MTATQERQPRAPRRQVLRVDALDGPWTVSVAENPHHPSSYTLYVKTPTHNLTLSRTAREIIELDHKLHDAYPGVLLPVLPIDSSALRQPVKHKPGILNTLPRLASPASKSTWAPINAHPSTASSPVPSALPTPVVSPKAEIADPFFHDSGEVAVGTSTFQIQQLLALQLTAPLFPMTRSSARRGRESVLCAFEPMTSKAYASNVPSGVFVPILLHIFLPRVPLTSPRTTRVFSMTRGAL